MRLRTSDTHLHASSGGWPRLRFLLVLASILLRSPITAPAQSAKQLDSMEMRGAVGPYTIGLNYTTRNHVELVTAHYFYTSQLKDIALNGSVNGENVNLRGADDSIFHLHFVGNGSNGKDPLTFYNSVGLAGTWIQGSKTLPVDLKSGHSTANPGQRMYEDVTEKSDTNFEQMAQAARSAILAGDRKTAAIYVSFPLRVNLKAGLFIIRNAAQLQAQWTRIFTPALIEKLKATVPHEMFVHNGEAMLGDGEFWFGDKGLQSINSMF